MDWYVIRYRGTDERGRPALIVEDDGGAAYLVVAGTLSQREIGAGAAARLARRLGNAWSHVTDGPRASLGGIPRRRAETRR